MTRKRGDDYKTIIDENGEIVNFPEATPAGTPSNSLLTVQGAPTGFPVPTWIIDPAYGNIFTATFSAVAISAAQDAFEIVASQGSLVKIRAVTLGQYSDFGDPATTAEILSVLIVRGYTTAGTGGSTVTPTNFCTAGKSSR